MRIVAYVLMVLLIPNNMKAEVINIPTSSLFEINNLDTLKINLIDEYIILEQVYATLIKSNDSGFEFDLAESIRWSDNYLIIQIKKGLKNSAGNQLDVEDVGLMFKRIMTKSSPTHFKLTSVLFSNNVDEVIKVDKVKNNLVLKFKKKLDYIIPVLSHVDFGIIPREALDNNLNIKNFEITSGYYYLNPKTNELIPNIHFHNYDKRMLVVKLNTLSADNFIRDFSRLDFIPSWFQFSKTNVNLEKFKQHSTVPLKLWKLVLTEAGAKLLSVPERYYVTNFIKNTFESYQLKISNQVYLEGSPLALDDHYINNQRLNYIKFQNKPDVKIKIAISKNRVTEWGKYFADKQFEIISFNTMDEAKQAHFILKNQDIGYDDDVSFISYSLKSGAFGIGGAEAESFLNNYMNQDNKIDRIKVIKNIGKYVVENVTIIPIYFEEYKTYYKPHLKIDFPKNNAGTPLWKIQHAN